MNHIPKFHNNPTVNMSGIVVLLRPLWVSIGKEKATMRRTFLLALTFFTIPHGENSCKWVSNMVLKFYDDPMVNRFEIIIFLRQVWWYTGKRESFESRKRENEIERKRRRRKYSQSQNWPKISLFIVWYSQSIIYSIFLLF